MIQDTSNIKSLEDARREFSTVYKCRQHLKRLRWPDGVECPRCGAKHPGWIATRSKWQCKQCRYQFSITTQTIFHRSHIGLPKWFIAIWSMCHSPKGISAKQLERELGVSYETAWYMAKRIRKAMRHDVFEKKLCGIVEVDEALVKADGGRAYGNFKYGAKHVLGMVSRDEGTLRMFVVESLLKEHIRHVVARNLGNVIELVTDATTRYRFMGEIAPHRYVAHFLSYSDKKGVHTNFIENAWSLFKRGLVGMYHHVSAKYLQEYLDEFAFRYTHREEKQRLFDLVLAGC